MWGIHERFAAGGLTYDETDQKWECGLYGGNDSASEKLDKIWVNYYARLASSAAILQRFMKYNFYILRVYAEKRYITETERDIPLESLLN